MDERQFDHGQEDTPSGGDLADAGTSAGAGSAGAGPPPSAAELDRQVAELTAIARARAAVVAIETRALVDAVAALRPLERRLGVTWRQWVAWRCGLTTAEARRICLLAEKLPSLPLLDAAFRAGELSDGVTEILARVATPANEAAVLAATASATGAQLQQIARDFRTVRAGATPPAGAEHVDPATMPSEASWGWDEHGRYHGSWTLRAEDGAILETALEAALARFRSTEADVDDAGGGQGAGRPTDPAEAPGDRVSASTAGLTSDDRAAGAAEPAGDARPSSPPDADAGVSEGRLREGERPRTRQSDALVALASMVLAAEADDGLLPESAQVIVLHNLTPTGRLAPDGTLLPDGRDESTASPPSASGSAPSRDPDPNDGGPPGGRGSSEPELDDPLHRLTGTTMPGCGAIPDWVAGLLACDSLLITVDMIAGFPVSEPTAKRSFNRAQRRALRARDRHCRFPGCTRTRHLHAHHTRPWHPTKRTTVADAVLLCHQHHTLVHLKGYAIALGVDHVTTVTRADGTVLRGTAVPPPDPGSLARHRGGGPRPGGPPLAERRRTGTGERLTHYARDVLATSWHEADAPATAHDPDPPP